MGGGRSTPGATEHAGSAFFAFMGRAIRASDASVHGGMRGLAAGEGSSEGDNQKGALTAAEVALPPLRATGHRTASMTSLSSLGEETPTAARGERVAPASAALAALAAATAAEGPGPPPEPAATALAGTPLD